MASIRKLADGRWQAQLRPISGGKQITKTTRRKADAQRWLDEQQASLVTGTYIDAKASRILFREYFQEWSSRQIWVTGTRRSMEATARAAPFWDMRLGLIQRSHVESWVKAMQTTYLGNQKDAAARDGLSPATIKSRFAQIRNSAAGRRCRQEDGI